MVERERILVANIIEEGRWGGPQKRISMVARALLDLDVETVVILPERDSARFRESLSEGGVPFITLRLTRLERKAKALLGYFCSFIPDVFRLYRTLKQRPYDLVHISGGAWQIKGALAARWAGIPIIWHLNDTKMPPAVAAVFSFLAPRLAIAFFVAADRCRTTYLSSRRLAAFPCYLVPAPVDTRSRASPRHPPDARICALAGVKIVSVANINPIKGLETLISATELLHKAGHDFTVAIIGPVFETQVKYFSSLQQRVAKSGLEKRVVFLGGVEDAVPCMEAADIYVCSSVAEASPMTVWEAMSASKPVVSTDVGDVSTYVRSGESGYVVPIGDSPAIAAAILTLMNDAEKRMDFGERARKIVEANLDLLVVAKKTVDSYRKVLALEADGFALGGPRSGSDCANLTQRDGNAHSAELARGAGPVATRRPSP